MSQSRSSSVEQIEDEEKFEEKPSISDNNKNDGDEKINSVDELSALEQEIAKIHHAEEFTASDCSLEQTTKNAFQNDIINESNNDNGPANEGRKQCPEDLPDDAKPNSGSLQKAMDVLMSNTNPLDPYDLIAVLKGLDTTQPDQLNANAEVAIKTENVPDSVPVPTTTAGVTIEGEGEYQIMEVIDDDSNPQEAEKSQPETSPAPRPPNVVLKRYPTFPQLSIEAERALALEQMACLKTDRNRRRKQDIKSLHQSDNHADLVSSLGAEWSDEELNNGSTSNVPATDLPELPKDDLSTGGSKIKSQPEITSVVVIPSPLSQIKQEFANNTSKSEETETNVKDAEDPKTHQKDPQSNQTGFRRTRIIKRKIIWDPDAPETTFSYAKLVKPNSSNTNRTTASKGRTSMIKGSTTITSLKKSPTATPSPTPTRKIKPVNQKEGKKPAADIKSGKKSPTGARTGQQVGNKQGTSETATNPTSAIKAETTPTPIKRRSQTPVANGSSITKKKKLTEIESLMRDEGALNMLNALEHERHSSNVEGKLMRPMMRNRATTICEKIPRKEATKAVATTTSARCDTPITPSVSSRTAATKNKRTPKSKASDTWDYVYKKQQVIDDSMIIRRRSNSSYSSNTSMQRLSLDAPPPPLVSNSASSTTASKAITSNSSKPATTTESATKRVVAKPKSLDVSSSSKGLEKTNTATASEGKTFEFAKPENRADQRNSKRTKSPAGTFASDLKKSTTLTNSRRNVRSPAAATTEHKDVKSTKASTMTSDHSKESTSAASATTDVVIKKSAKVAQIIFNTSKAKLNYTFTIQMMNKLADILEKLNEDNDCHAVVICSTNPHFCQGIDITDLTVGSLEKRKSTAVALGTAVKNYLKALVRFTKPLLAAVNGHNINFGVTQLALYDVVVAGDKSTFETPYAKLGQAPEGYCIWSNITKIHGSCKTKLFWLCEKLVNSDAVQAGLVTKLTTTSKANDEAVNIARKIAGMPVEAYRSMKRTLFQNNHSSVFTSLDEEFDAIIKQWTSSDCLDRMKKYIELGHF